jgi:hypothetical protein
MTRDSHHRQRRRRARGRRRPHVSGWRIQNPPETVRSVAGVHRCPDCISTVDEPVLADGTSRVWLLNVRHADTCPTYRRLQAEGLAT